MNYQRIYDAFIADRRTCEDTSRLLDSYTEKHHILPRSLGGGNSAANLIRLTVRDHYFAHCCLAKIHGGKMWAALRAMTVQQSATRRASLFVRGRFVEIAKREYAGYVSAQTKRKWAEGVFQDRVPFKGHTTESKALMAEAARGRTVTEETKAKMLATQQRKARRFTFFEIGTGREFSGTTLDFQRHAGVRQASASKLATGRAQKAQGWRLGARPGA